MLDSKEASYKILQDSEVNTLLENYRKIFKAAKKHSHICTLFEKELLEELELDEKD